VNPNALRSWNACQKRMSPRTSHPAQRTPRRHRPHPTHKVSVGRRDGAPRQGTHAAYLMRRGPAPARILREQGLEAPVTRPATFGFNRDRLAQGVHP
jgi:hypothetical protein